MRYAIILIGLFILASCVAPQQSRVQSDAQQYPYKMTEQTHQELELIKQMNEAMKTFIEGTNRCRDTFYTCSNKCNAEYGRTLGHEECISMINCRDRCIDQRSTCEDAVSKTIQSAYLD